MYLTSFPDFFHFNFIIFVVVCLWMSFIKIFNLICKDSLDLMEISLFLKTSCYLTSRHFKEAKKIHCD